MRGNTGRSGELGGSLSGNAAKAPTRVASTLGWAEIAVGKWALIAGGHHPTRHLTAQHDTRPCYSASRSGKGGAAMAFLARAAGLGRRRRRADGVDAPADEGSKTGHPRGELRSRTASTCAPKARCDAPPSYARAHRARPFRCPDAARRPSSPARKCDPSELEGGDMELDQGKSQ